MSSQKISQYSASELSDILRILQDYRLARKQIGSHARLRDPRVSEENTQIRILIPENENSQNVQELVSSFLGQYFSKADMKDVLFEKTKTLS